MKKETIVSGIKPTGRLHLGNYLGTISNWVNLQKEHECFYFVADYHALTLEWDPKELKQNIIDLTMDLIACGIDPQRSVLFIQSLVPEHCELCVILNNVTAFGDLMRMTQFKDIRQEMEGTREFLSAGLFDYPVLQTADVLAYRATRVPVGEDQLQHLELARSVARRFNGKFGMYFPEPEPLLTESSRLMSFADPALKMGKRYGPKHVIELMEPENSIWEKISSAVTDTAPGKEMSPGVKNLFLTLKLTAPQNVTEEFLSSYQNQTLKYVRLKQAVFEHLSALLAPIREKRNSLIKEEVQAIVNQGTEKARTTAKATLAEVKQRIGVGL